MGKHIAISSAGRHLIAMALGFPDPDYVEANGVKLAYYEIDGDAGQSKPPLILIHGWPEIAYCWRNQMQPLADAGFRVIAIDLKGFGKSDAPMAVGEYDIEHITSDLAAFLDCLNIDRAVFCGHDWGGSIVWSMAQWQPNRVAGVIGVCTPLRTRPPAPPIDIISNRFGEAHYIVQFQEEKTPEALFATDVERFVRLMFQKPATRDRWAELFPTIYDLPGRFKSDRPVQKQNLIVSDDIIQVYIDAYTRSGFHGGINLYRNINRNWELMEGRDEVVRAPSLWIGANLDMFLPPETADDMELIVPKLEKHVIDDCGHWVMWEKPDALNSLLIDWLKKQFS